MDRTMTKLSPEELEKERKFYRKAMRVGLRAAFMGGIGLAFFILQSLFSGIATDQRVNTLISSVALLLMAYGAAILVTYAVRRNMVLRVNLIMMMVVLPGGAIHIILQYLG